MFYSSTAYPVHSHLFKIALARYLRIKGNFFPQSSTLQKFNPAGNFGVTLRHLNLSSASARDSLPLQTSAMLFPGRPGAVGRFARWPTTDRDRMGSSKALVSRAAPRTLFALLVVLDGAVAMREPLPLSTWHALEQRDWRIASTKHANSYLFRVDQGEAGGAGIWCGARLGGADCNVFRV